MDGLPRPHPNTAIWQLGDKIGDKSGVTFNFMDKFCLKSHCVFIDCLVCKHRMRSSVPNKIESISLKL